MQTLYYIIIYYYNVKIFRKRNFVTPKPSYAPFCWCACVGIFTPREREIREAPRTVAAGVFGGCYGRRLRELSKGGVTDGGCGGLRRVLRTVAAGALEGRRYGRWLRELSKGDVTDGGCGGLRGVSRAVAACSRRPWCPPKLSAAVGRGASLRSFRCRRPWRLPSSLPLPSAVAPPFVPSAAVGRNSLRRFPLPSAVAPPFVPSAAVGRNSLRRFPLPSAVAPPLSLFREV